MNTDDSTASNPTPSCERRTLPSATATISLLEAMQSSKTSLMLMQRASHQSPYCSSDAIADILDDALQIVLDDAVVEPFEWLAFDFTGDAHGPEYGTTAYNGGPARQ